MDITEKIGSPDDILISEEFAEYIAKKLQVRQDDLRNLGYVIVRSDRHKKGWLRWYEIMFTPMRNIWNLNAEGFTGRLFAQELIWATPMAGDKAAPWRQSLEQLAMYEHIIEETGWELPKVQELRTLIFCQYRGVGINA